MKLGDLLNLAPDHIAANLEISGLSSDSRTTKPGDLFAALTGTLSDGRTFVDKAIGAGAVAILAEAGLADARVPVITVDNARDALSKAASRFYPRQPQTIVAVTGTNGKSSTVDFLRQIWTHAGHGAASVGTLGAIGLYYARSDFPARDFATLG